jgi:mRNA-degrading endonuclease RelE of RelBE toxin-antitoxin system
MFSVLVSKTFQSQFDQLDKILQERVRNGLNTLKKDPYKPRSGADIKVLENTDPQKYRLRVGDYRIVYCVDKTLIKVIEIFHRGRGY